MAAVDVTKPANDYVGGLVKSQGRSRDKILDDLYMKKTRDLTRYGYSDHPDQWQRKPWDTTYEDYGRFHNPYLGTHKHRLGQDTGSSLKGTGFIDEDNLPTTNAKYGSFQDDADFPGAEPPTHPLLRYSYNMPSDSDTQPRSMSGYKRKFMDPNKPRAMGSLIPDATMMSPRYIGQQPSLAQPVMRMTSGKAKQYVKGFCEEYWKALEENHKWRA